MPEPNVDGWWDKFIDYQFSRKDKSPWTVQNIIDAYCAEFQVNDEELLQLTTREQQITWAKVVDAIQEDS